MRTRISEPWILCLIAGLLLFASESGRAQGDQNTMIGATPGGSTTNFHFAEPNELTITVSILGAIQRPGRYEISRTIDLPNLLSLAGGTAPNADIKDVRIMRTFKDGPRVQRKEVRLNLEEKMLDPDADLRLNQGDFIMVGQTSWTTVSDVLLVLTTAAVITTAVVSVVNMTK